MPTQFLYFDLGRVLLLFSRQRQYRQMADVGGITPEQVREAFADKGLQEQYETGQFSSSEMYERFCEETGARCDFEPLRHACSDIFSANASMIPVIGNLWSAGYRLGILSNTCASHWDFCTSGRFAILTNYFEQIVLSYEVGAMKPDATIYAAAADKAGVAPQEIFFTDDREENVEGAREFGFDAVLYTSTPALVRELAKRGVRFNY